MGRSRSAVAQTHDVDEMFQGAPPVRAVNEPVARAARADGKAKEEKAANFSRLATRRVTAALDNIRRIGKLSNRGSYCYEPEQVDKMFKAMRAGLDEAEKRFGATGGPSAFSFD